MDSLKGDNPEKQNGEQKPELVLIVNKPDMTVYSNVPTSPVSCVETKVYTRRWLMLGLFIFTSMINAFQWIQFSIIFDAITDFYNVPSTAVDWTSMVYMVAYIPLIFPASFLLNKKGLRYTIILGILGTAIGAWIKVGAASPDRFWVAMLGQTVAAISQVFILGTPSHLAAIWFGPDQVSSATAIGVFGNQVGVALGFVLPPVLVPYTKPDNSSQTWTELASRSESLNEEYMAKNLFNMYLGVACVSTAVLFAVLFFFKEKPPLPPSQARLTLESQEENFVLTMKRLAKNRGYILLLVTYGINTGVFYAISTLLSQIIGHYFTNSQTEAGLIGLTMVVSGVAGSVVGGIILDKTHKFKETTVGIYILSFLGLLTFTLTLDTGVIEIVFFTSALLGFFMTGYLPVGFEFAAELTYPEPEGTSSGLLNASAQVFGIVLTLLAGALMNTAGDLVSNLVLCGLLLLGSIFTFLIKSDLRRQAAQVAHEPVIATLTDKGL